MEFNEPLEKQYIAILKKLHQITMIAGEPFDMDNRKHRLVAAYQLGQIGERERINQGIAEIKAEFGGD